MNILIVDDSIDKIARVVSVIEEVSSDFVIDSVNDSYRAQQKLMSKKYDLLIVDLLLPVRIGEEPLKNGGELLIKEITRKKVLIPPSIIVGITQHEEYELNFSSIWKLLFFNKGNWINDLKELVEHSYRSRQYLSEKIDIKPTIYVEGQTDYTILREAINLFRPDHIDKIDIKTEKSAGASWVANQIIIWAHSLHKKNGSNQLIRSVGLLDGDAAGNIAIYEINRIIKSDSTGASSFKIFKLKPDYAKEIVPLYQKGLVIPVTMEELYSTDFWEYSEKQKWLENRGNPDLLLKDPKSWDKMSQSLSDYINSLSLNNSEKRYLKSFKQSCKENATKCIIGLEKKEKEKVLENFKYLVNDIINYING
jgi:CheY-like chemotaxis protein